MTVELYQLIDTWIKENQAAYPHWYIRKLGNNFWIDGDDDMALFATDDRTQHISVAHNQPVSPTASGIPDVDIDRDCGYGIFCRNLLAFNITKRNVFQRTRWNPMPEFAASDPEFFEKLGKTMLEMEEDLLRRAQKAVDAMVEVESRLHLTFGASHEGPSPQSNGSSP